MASLSWIHCHTDGDDSDDNDDKDDNGDNDDNDSIAASCWHASAPRGSLQMRARAFIWSWPGIIQGKQEASIVAVPGFGGLQAGAYHPRWFMAPSHTDPADAVRIVDEARLKPEVLSSASKNKMPEHVRRAS